jgi:ABC-type bacteriocin/lantibiotic exporter with double-glycine peptidase domain
VKAAELARLVGAESLDQPITWVLAEPSEPAKGLSPLRGNQHLNGHVSQAAIGGVNDDPAPHSGHGAHPEVPPLKRLLGLFRPESHDVGLLVAYSAAVGFLGLATPLAVESLVTTVAFGTLLQPLLVLAAILLGCLTLAGALRGMQAYLAEVIERRLFVRMAVDLAERLPRTRLDYHDSHDGAEMVNRFFDIVTVQKAAATLLLEAVALILSTTISLVILAFYHPFMLAFDVLLIALLGGIIFGLGRGNVRTAIAESRAKYAMAAWLEELARQPAAFKFFRGPLLARERAEALAVEYLACRKVHFGIVIRQILAALLLQAGASTAVLALGGWLVINGQLTLGQLVATELMVTLVVGSFAKLGKHIQTWCDLLAACDKLGHLTDIPLEPSGGEARCDGALPAAINARRLTYGWHPTHPILEDFDLQVAPGERVAVCGPHGSGKSTLVELLAGLREPVTGRVEFDHIDLRDVRREAARAHVALARGVEILDESILENVRMGRDELTISEVRWALEATGLLDDVLALPEGLQTRLRREGAPLSRSQALRLAIARAIVGGPRLLLVDETLDGLDPDALEVVLKTLCDPRAPWTLVLATRRPDVADRCDRVVELTRRGQRLVRQGRLSGPPRSATLSDGRNQDDETSS